MVDARARLSMVGLLRTRTLGLAWGRRRQPWRAANTRSHYDERPTVERAKRALQGESDGRISDLVVWDWDAIVVSTKYGQWMGNAKAFKKSSHGNFPSAPSPCQLLLWWVKEQKQARGGLIVKRPYTDRCDTFIILRSTEARPAVVPATCV